MECDFCANWTNELLKGLEKAQNGSCDPFTGCADFHYRINHMDEVLELYVGNLPDFLAFLEEKLGWKITISSGGRVITADEGKAECVCPIAGRAEGTVSGMLCNCSAWYAKRMFSKVCGRDVHAEVKRSVLRDGKSCIYEITIPDTTSE